MIGLRFTLFLFAFVLVAFNMTNVVTAATLSPDQQRVFREGILYFNTEETCASGNTSIPNGSVDQNGKAIYDFLTASGRLKPYQAAGVIGNMIAESGLQPQRLEGTGSGVVTTAEQYVQQGLNKGWGLVQFTPGTKFINQTSPISTANELGTQISFIWDQLEGRTVIPEKTAGDDLKATTTIEEAVLAFQGNKSVGGKYLGYERPLDQRGTVAVRTSNAKVALAKYGSGVASTNTSAEVVTCGEAASTGSNVSRNGFSLPLDQKWYAQHPEWFTKPHHDHPAADIPVPTGTKVYSMTNGTIKYAPASKLTGECGQGIIISGEDGNEYWYCHGVDGGTIPGAKQGDTIKAGQLIMHSGNTGRSTGPHLHVAIYVSGAKVCPQNLLKALGEGSATLPQVGTLPRSGCTN